jgi:hypothetical protein
MPTHKYAPVGHCIYCGQVPSDQPLTVEHIIPLSLGGELLLPASSCIPCAAITGHIEGIVCGSMLKAVRTHLGMKSRRPKERPTTLPVKQGKGGVEVPIIEVPINEHPFYLALQEFERPQILKRPRRWQERDDELHWRMHTAPDTAKRHDALGNAGVQLFRINPDNMQRMLAKMAHSYAIAELGSDVFRPFLPDLILNKRPSRNWLVGSKPGENRPPPNSTWQFPTVVHSIELRRERGPNMTFLTCDITLFAEHGMPVYEVIVGPITKDINSPDPLRLFRSSPADGPARD